MSPSKFVFMACVAFKVCFRGVCRPQSLFSWRVSPSKFVFMACVAIKLVFVACVFMACVAFNLVFIACVAIRTSFRRVSPSKFVFMVCPLTTLFPWRGSRSI